MSELNEFDFQGDTVRTMLIDGDPWFVLRDVADAIGVARRPSAIVERLDRDEVRQTYVIDSMGREQLTLIVNEPGLYDVVLRSDAPRARDFRRWVTHDVLPQIRRTGSYVAPPTLPQTYAEALRELADASERRAALEARVAADAPKVEYVDQFVDRDDVATFRAAASELGVREGELRDRLLEAGWIYRHAIGRRYSDTQQRYVDEYEYRAAAAHGEKFALRPQHHAPRHHNGQVRQTLYVRQAALPALRRFLAREIELVR